MLNFWSDTIHTKIKDVNFSSFILSSFWIKYIGWSTSIWSTKWWGGHCVTSVVQRGINSNVITYCPTFTLHLVIVDVQAAVKFFISSSSRLNSVNSFTNSAKSNARVSCQPLDIFNPIFQVCTAWTRYQGLEIQVKSH